jgi:hypothetical protein
MDTKFSFSKLFTNIGLSAGGAFFATYRGTGNVKQAALAAVLATIGNVVGLLQKPPQATAVARS